MAIHIESLAKADELAAKAVKERGREFIYEMPDEYASCVYFVDGSPSCLIGLMLSYLGFTPEMAGRCNSRGVAVLHDKGILEAPQRVLTFLADLQTAQDDGRTYGWALDMARTLALGALEDDMQHIKYLATL